MKALIGVAVTWAVLATSSMASAQSRIVIGDPPRPLSPVLFGPPDPDLAPECLVWNWQQYTYYNVCPAGYRRGALRVRG